jgi:alpha-tubulin suppressor-like RCC1 family protein
MGLIILLASQSVLVSSPAHALLAITSNPVSAGSSSTCVIRSADDLYCVGSNTFGQLGNGNQTSTSDPQKVNGISNVSAVSVGTTSACAVTYSGALYCWGENTVGQLGLGDTQNRNTATLVPGLTNVVQVAVGEDFACALTASSALYCWGANDKGQLTTDKKLNVSTPSLTSQTPSAITRMAISGKRICVVAADVYCWGDFASFVFPNQTRNWVPTKLIGSTGAKSVELGSDFGCFTLSLSVACWGSNEHGQLGLGTRTLSANPVTVTGITAVKDLTAGNHFACALDLNNDTFCWGENGAGQLVVSSKNDQLNRVPTGAPKSANIDAGANNLCLMKLDAVVSCYGDSNAGQSGVLTSSNTPLANTSFSNASNIDSGLNTTCAVTTSGSLECWGDLVPVVTSGLSFTGVSVGDSSACAISDTKKIFCWGSNTSGQLGNNTTRTSLGMTEISLTTETFRFVAVGSKHACAVTEGGLIYCWGDNAKQQLGFVGADSRVPLAVPGIGTATSVSVGDYHSCVIQAGDAVSCWGDNSKKQISLINTNLLTPTPLVVESPVTAISLGANNTCILDSNKALKCFGDNTKKAAPGLVVGTYTEVSTSGNTVCAINTEYKVYCFGSAESSKLGSAVVDTLTPTKISDELMSSISVGSKHVCSIDKVGKISCWGSNLSGQLTSSFGFPTAFAKPLVTVSGSKAVGETLQATVTGAETKVTFSYSWKRASSISGLPGTLTTENGPSYKLSGSDLAKYFAVEIRLHKWGTTSIGYTSPLTTAIVKPIRLLFTPAPIITGTAKAGKVLIAKPGGWDSGVKLSYQWYRGNVLVKGATRATYAVTSKDVGKQLYVSVTGTKIGFPKVVTKSTRTAKTIR